MRPFERQRIDRVCQFGQYQRFPFAIEPTKNGIGQLAGAKPMSALGKLDGLRDGCVRRHTLHEEQLRRTESEQIEQVGVETDHATTNAGVEEGVDASAPTKGSVDELSHPPAVARIELRGATIERRVEHVAAANVGANLRGRYTRVRYGARMMCDSAACSSTSPSTTRRTVVVTRPWHTS
jgi:hypothetical protein